MPPLQVFKIFNAPPPEFGIEVVQSGILSYHRYNLQFLKMSDRGVAKGGDRPPIAKKTFSEKD
jgi:hypothetical protein